MAKKIDTTPVTTQEETAVETPELTHSAFTLVRVGNRYSVLRVKINPITNTVGPLELVKDDMGKEEGQEVFKINVARDIFMKQG